MYKEIKKTVTGPSEEHYKNSIKQTHPSQDKINLLSVKHYGICHPKLKDQDI
jgi:hypothetical protein